MIVAYLTNQYPKVSHTFIRREIAALERLGIKVLRFGIRRSVDQLVDPADQAEAARTTVVLDAGPERLAGAIARVAARSPLRLGRAAALAARIGARSERGLARHGAYLAEACFLVEAFRAEGVEHVHAHFGSNSAAVAMLVHELGGPRFSFTAHGPEEFDKAPLWSLRQKIERAAFVVGVSEFGRSQLCRQCAHAHWHKLHVVRCGVDPTLFDRPAAPIPTAPKLVSVGRLSEQKGQLVLMAALAELARAGVPFEMTLVGDGEMRAEVEAAISAGRLGGQVRITGWADGDAVRRALDEARALILPSFAEGLPVVLMEALARGRPCVSTFVAGIPELVEPGENGWLVPAGAVGPLAAAIRAVLAAPPAELARMGEHGRKRVRAMHDIDRIAAGLAELFAHAGA